MDTRDLLREAEHAARVTGMKLKDIQPSMLRSSGKDMKITADREAHAVVVGELEKSGIPVLSEEDDVHDFGADLKWIVDPLDGSVNFFRGIPACAVAIGLSKQGKPVLGVVYDFQKEELFSGIVGTAAWLNGKPIHVSDTREKRDAILMTGFPSFTDYSTEALEKYISHIQAFKKIRHIGSAALSLAYVAAGRADAYYEKDIKIWDVAAGLALVEAAGGSYVATNVDAEGGCAISAHGVDDLTSRFNSDIII